VPCAVQTFMCICIFCTTLPKCQLPVPGLVVRTLDQYSFWVWIVNANPLELYVDGVCAHQFASFGDAARFVWSRVMGLQSVSDFHVLVRTPTGVARWQSVSQIFSATEKEASPPPSRQDAHSSCICTQLATPPMRHASVMHAVASHASSSSSSYDPQYYTYQGEFHSSSAPSNDAPTTEAPICTSKRAKTRNVHSHSKLACASYERSGSSVGAGGTCVSRRRSHAPTTIRQPRGQHHTSSDVNALESSEVPTSIVAMTLDRADGNGTSNDALAQMHLAYTVDELGGDPVEVGRILECRRKWDSEVVEELIRWGARPKLFEVRSVYDVGAYVKVQCTFVQLDGRLVHDVWMPLEYMRMDYASHVRHIP